MMDYLDIKINPSDIPDELFNGKLSDKDFFTMLKSIVHAVKTDEQCICDIKISHSLRVLQVLCNILKYVPFFSLFVYYVNPGRYRTVPGYVGKNFRRRFYIKNKQIPITSFSSNVVESLKLNLLHERFVESSYEAKFLNRKFRKVHNISGGLEKAKTVLCSNKFIAYILFIMAFLVMLVVTTVMLLLVHFNILPGVFFSRFIDVVRGICDSFFVISGLDPIVDKVLTLILDVVGIVIRIVDFILLCGLLSEIVRLVIRGVKYIITSVCNVFQDVFVSLATYGLKDSIIILFSKILCSDHITLGNSCESKEEISVHNVRKYNTDYNIAEMLENICDKVNVELPTLSKVIDITKKLSSQIDQNLYCGKPRVVELLRNFENSTCKLPQSTIGSVNYLKLKYEFSYLLNNYVRNFRYDNSGNSSNILNSFQKRQEIYNRITAVNLQTKYFCKNSHRTICTVSDVECVFDKMCNIGNPITVEALNAKMASLKWAIHMLDVCDVYGIKRRSELIFVNTRLDNVATVMLYDCILRLEGYRKYVQSGKIISEDFVDVDIKCNFFPYIRDVYHILQALDTSIMYNSQIRSLKIFCDVFFGDNSLLLKKPSDQARNLADMVSVGTGVVSCLSELKEYICQSIECIQNPKNTAISFLIYYLIRLTDSSALLNMADSTLEAMDQMLNVIGINDLYDYFTQTDFGKMLLLEFYQQGMLFQDLACMLAELNLGLLCDDIDEVQDDYLSICDINQVIYHSSFHRVNTAQQRVLEYMNGCARFIYEIAGLKLVKHIAHCFKEKVMYNMECFMLRESIVSNSMLINGQEHVSSGKLECGMEEKISCESSKSNGLLLGPGGVYHMLELGLNCD
ncbi:hypothetical protein [Ehrlichia ruminantium]|uniref:hypothetical protein n=1 Tax=Ehrlichia ruminantium TaxID=779 RepID=UPI001E4868A4|nr:hypothetical protein [Ehrlichia ruminantium]